MPPTPPALLDEVRQKVLTDPLYGRAFLQERAKADLRYCCRTLLGFAEMNQEHEALCDFLQHDPAQTKLILMPRYTFKSSIVTIGYSLWKLLNDPNERLLLYSDATEKAEGFLVGIKNHLLGLIATSHFRAVCGAWEVDPKRGVWNQSALVIAPRTQAHAEPSIETAGLETSKVGKHYSHITFDDLVSDKNITTKDLLDKVESCYKKALSLLMPSGTVCLAGTRWHFGDLYGRLLAEYKGQPGFSLFHRKAHEGDTYFFADIGKDSLTPTFLRQKKATQGSALYSCLYQNEPVDEATALFKSSDFAFYPPPTGPDARAKFCRDLFISCCLDPATGKAGAEDRAALSVVGTDSEMNMYLLDLVSGQMSPAEQVEEVFSLYAHWRFQVFGIETNAFQEMLKRDIEFRAQEERQRNPAFRLFPIQSFTASSANTKEMRIRALQPYHERRALRLPGERLETLQPPYSDLTFQMLSYTPTHKPLHEDELDSLAYHVLIHRPGRVTVPTQTIPPLSPAWFERQQRDQELQAYADRPRWARGRVPDSELALS